MPLSLNGFAVLLLIAFAGVPLVYVPIVFGVAGFIVARAEIVGQALIWWSGDLALSGVTVGTSGQTFREKTVDYSCLKRQLGVAKPARTARLTVI